MATATTRDRIPARPQPERPLWAYDGPDYTHTAAAPGGRPLRCYDGVWCARTAGGWWRSARWLGVLTETQEAFLDPIEHHPVPVTEGQVPLW